MLCFTDLAGPFFHISNKNVNHVIKVTLCKCMTEEACSSLYEWLSMIIKEGAIVVKNRSRTKCCCKEIFGAFVSSRTWVQRRESGENHDLAF